MVAKINAPAFDLAEAGATLQKDEAQPITDGPDTSSLSIAQPGVELLKPEDKHQDPNCSAPNTSKLSLLNNADI